MATPKIILYTNHTCPWAHRAHIALKELSLPYTEEIIDLSVPRTPEYLKINPRGLVPSLNYNGEIITESAIVAQFLADAHPSHLLKASNAEGGALQRARIAFFVDAFISKVNGVWFKLLGAQGEEDKEREVAGFVGLVVKELEPLLQDAKPFFGGASELTLAEVLTGSFLLRILSLPTHDLAPPSLLTSLERQAPAFWAWAHAVVAKESVNYIWDEERVAAATKAMVARLAAAK